MAAAEEAEAIGVEEVLAEVPEAAEASAVLEVEASEVAVQVEAGKKYLILQNGNMHECSRFLLLICRAHILFSLLLSKSSVPFI